MTAGIYFILAPDHHDRIALSAALNERDSVLSLGHGNPGRTVDEKCSCGEMVSSCPFWTQMSAAAENDESLDGVKERPFPNLLPQVPVLLENEKLNNAIIAAGSLLANEVGYKAWRFAAEGAERFFGMHDRFLTAAQEWYPHTAFVDGEGSLLKFMAMTSIGFPVKGVIHLVRDPRTYVAERRAAQPGVTVEKLAMEWLARHKRIRKIMGFFTRVPVLTLRQEDGIADMPANGARIARFLGLEDGQGVAQTPAAHKRHVLGAPTAAMAGLPPLTAKDRETVERLTSPLFSEFGYKS